MLKRSTIIAALLSLSSFVNGQTIGGDNTYEFLNLTHSGLVASLGGTNVSLNSNNINLSYHNPSLLKGTMAHQLALDYVNYFAGINYGLALYGQQITEKANIAGGVAFYSYGKFTEADPTGTIIGDFTASEFTFPVIYSRAIDSSFTVGATFKPVLSHLEKYTSIGFAFDFGANYVSPNRLFSAGLTVRNLGIQLTKYAGEERMKLPFSVEAGVTQGLEYAPLRFSLTLVHLEKYNLIHDTGNENATYFANSKIVDNILRHTVIGMEIIPIETFYISLGYNYLLRKEFYPGNTASGIGFNWGFGINTSLVNIELAKSIHMAGGSTHISLIAKMDKLYNR